MESIENKTVSKYLRFTKNDTLPVHLLENIYIGSIGAAYNKSSLTEFGITNILTVASNLPPNFPDDF